MKWNCDKRGGGENYALGGSSLARTDPRILFSRGKVSECDIILYAQEWKRTLTTIPPSIIEAAIRKKRELRQYVQYGFPYQVPCKL